MNDTLRVLLVDDEALARARLRRLLGAIERVDVVGEAGSVPEARAARGLAPPDLVLLDVQMPGEDGFELLTRVAHRPAVVFVTAFDHYAVRAFEEHAVDYLLKPFRPERLAGAIERVRASLANPESLARQLQQVLASVGAARAERPETLERFTVRIGQKQLIVKADEVLWFGAEDKLVFAATPKDRHYCELHARRAGAEARSGPVRARAPLRDREPGPRRRPAAGLRGHVAAAARRRRAHRGPGVALEGARGEGAARGVDVRSRLEIVLT
jgi:DNA-binding LytR/AlgR family response regulator